MRLAEFFERYAKGAGVKMADQLAIELRKILNVQAPVRRTRSGKLVATTKARPFAIPRKVTGKLRNSVKVIRTPRGASVQVYARYGVFLEKGKRPYGFPHKFVSVALKNLGLRGRNS